MTLELGSNQIAQTAGARPINCGSSGRKLQISGSEYRSGLMEALNDLAFLDLEVQSRKWLQVDWTKTSASTLRLPEVDRLRQLAESFSG